MKLSIKIYVVTMFCFCFSAKADTVNDVIRLTCEDSLGYFELSYTNINGRLAATAFQNSSNNLYNKYGFVAVDNIIDAFNYDCKLNGKIYKIQLSTDMGIGCTGTKISSITITQGDKLLLDKVPLADCDTYGVDMIKMLPEEGYIQFMGHDTLNNWKYNIYYFKDLKQLPAIQAFKK